ncbi:MAG: transglutaminase family protein [Verrucomicrobiota bacterium]
MKLHVVHRTRYDYTNPVRASYNEARLQPTSSEGQECHSFILRVLPATRLSHYNDFYNNIVHFFEVPESHGFLSIESSSIVTTTDSSLPEDREVAPMNRLPELMHAERFYDFLQMSSFVSLDVGVWRLALDATAGCEDVWQAALAIMRFIHANFSYSPNSTHVNTHMLDVLEQRRGVCQDFAHVMLGMCRVLGIPARYVSGYIYSDPAEHLTGAQASHAWCEVYLPEIGWRGLDPTNNRQADRHHVKIGVGRDYADIVPLKGHYRGTHEKRMSVEVSVTRSA